MLSFEPNWKSVSYVDVRMEMQCCVFTATEGEDVHLEVMVQLRAEMHILAQLL